MADLSSDTGNDPRVRPDRESPPGMPTWVKVMGITFLVLIVVFIILHLAGGGMRMHGGRALPASVTEYRVQLR